MSRHKFKRTALPVCQLAVVGVAEEDEAGEGAVKRGEAAGCMTGCLENCLKAQYLMYCLERKRVIETT